MHLLHKDRMLHVLQTSDCRLAAVQIHCYLAPHRKPWPPHVFPDHEAGRVRRREGADKHGAPPEQRNLKKYKAEKLVCAQHMQLTSTAS